MRKFRMLSILLATVLISLPASTAAQIRSGEFAYCDVYPRWIYASDVDIQLLGAGGLARFTAYGFEFRQKGQGPEAPDIQATSDYAGNILVYDVTNSNLLHLLEPGRATVHVSSTVPNTPSAQCNFWVYE